MGGKRGLDRSVDRRPIDALRRRVEFGLVTDFITIGQHPNRFDPAVSTCAEDAAIFCGRGGGRPARDLAHQLFETVALASGTTDDPCEVDHRVSDYEMMI